MAGVRKDLTRSLYLYGTAVLVLFGALMAGIMNGNETRPLRRGPCLIMSGAAVQIDP